VVGATLYSLSIKHVFAWPLERKKIADRKIKTGGDTDITTHVVI
jgi:hypothetical protein